MPEELHKMIRSQGTMIGQQYDEIKKQQKAI